MIDDKYGKDSYYDGHYIDSQLSPEEREKKEKESMASDAELTEWPEPNT